MKESASLKKRAGKVENNKSQYLRHPQLFLRILEALDDMHILDIYHLESKTSLFDKFMYGYT